MNTGPDLATPLLGAVVLTGGTGRRLGGVDKASLEVGGVTLLERALAAMVGADETVVVGDRVPTSRPVTWAREEPPGGGPAAGLLAGLDAFTRKPDLLCVLAVDMPGVVAATVERLTAAVADAHADAAVLVDGDGLRQPLAGVYRYDALQAARPPNSQGERGLPVRRLIAPLHIVEVVARGPEGRDVDTWDDLRDLERDR